MASLKLSTRCGALTPPVSERADRRQRKPGTAHRLFSSPDNHQNSNFLFRPRYLRNHLGNFIEYLVPALHLTAILRALHGFISNEGEFRLAVPEISKMVTSYAPSMASWSIPNCAGSTLFPFDSEKYTKETHSTHTFATYANVWGHPAIVAFSHF